MINVQWTSKAISGLARLYDFLAPVNRRAAAQIVQSITVASMKLIEHPRLGERLEEFAPREVRRLLIGRYEMRYEVQGSVIHVLRVWHTREDR